MSGCTLCPRECGANREGGQRGRCHADAEVRIARAALHFWEETCISLPMGAPLSLCQEKDCAGTERPGVVKGSGAVFFLGCPLGCVYCQNRAISQAPETSFPSGTAISVERLADIFLELQVQGAANINLVTAGHYAPQVCVALGQAKKRGLVLPVVWNSSGYEKVETLRMLEGLVDVYLPDLKYLDSGLAGRYSHAADYPDVARNAIREMVRQQPSPHFDAAGRMTAGVIVRHLLLPGHVREAKRIVSYLHEAYGERIYLSLMNQYTPPDPGEFGGCGRAVTDPLLLRRVTKREYGRLLDYAVQIGVCQGFYQEGETAAESFIPAFDGTGVKPSGVCVHLL